MYFSSGFGMDYKLGSVKDTGVDIEVTLETDHSNWIVLHFPSVSAFAQLANQLTGAAHNLLLKEEDTCLC